MKDLISQWKKDEQASFAGWDFSYLKDRKVETKSGWNYELLAKELMIKSNSFLDIATGGGEILSRLGAFPKEAYAIEGYEPNVSVAQKKLESLGIEVIFNDEMNKYPFLDDKFDLILNRHGGLNLPEIYRVLNKGGHFLTQQVGGDNLDDLLSFFDKKPKWPENTLEIVSKKIKEMGFKITKSEKWNGHIKFLDVGALVYFLKNIPWVVDNFSVDNHFEYLKKLQMKLEKGEELKFNLSRFIILAEK